MKVSEVKCFAQGLMTFTVKLVMQNQAAKPKAFCAAQKRYDIGTQSPTAPSDTCLALLHAYQCGLFHESVSFGFSHLLIYKAVTEIQKASLKTLIKPRGGLGSFNF